MQKFLRKANKMFHHNRIMKLMKKIIKAKDFKNKQIIVNLNLICIVHILKELQICNKKRKINLIMKGKKSIKRL